MCVCVCMCVCKCLAVHCRCGCIQDKTANTRPASCAFCALVPTRVHSVDSVIPTLLAKKLNSAWPGGFSQVQGRAWRNRDWRALEGRVLTQKVRRCCKALNRKHYVCWEGNEVQFREGFPGDSTCTGPSLESAWDEWEQHYCSSRSGAQGPRRQAHDSSMTWRSSRRRVVQDDDV